jgi:mannosyltransferase
VGSLALLPAVVLAVALWWSSRGGPPGRVPARDALLFGAWALLPPLGLVLASFAQPVLVARYALVAVPALVLLVGLLAHTGGGRQAALTVAVAVLASVGVVVVQQSQAYKYENFRAAADAVVDNAQPGDALLFLPSSYRVGYYEYPRPDRNDPHTGQAVDVALLAPARWRDDSVIGGRECAPDALPSRVDAHDRVFLVGSLLGTAVRQRHAPGELAKEQILRAGYRQAWAVSYGGVSVTLLIRDAGGLPVPPPQTQPRA